MFLQWAIIFGVLSVVAGLFGFTGISAGTAGIAKTLFFIFLAMVIVFTVLGFIIV